jgi:hypothetical protein
MGMGTGTRAMAARLTVGALLAVVATATPLLPLLPLPTLGAPAAGAARAVPGIAAQTTPTAEPDVPQPDECRVAPRTGFTVPREVPSAAASPAAAPVATPVAAEPVDAAVAEAVAATIREAVACRNAGDLPRAYALFTDDLVLDLLGSAETVPPEIVAALVEPGRRAPRASRLELVAVGPPTPLGDGRVLARVETRSAGVAYVDDLVFREVAGRWLIDDAFAVVGEGE